MLKEIENLREIQNYEVIIFWKEYENTASYLWVIIVQSCMGPRVYQVWLYLSFKCSIFTKNGLEIIMKMLHFIVCVFGEMFLSCSLKSVGYVGKKKRWLLLPLLLFSYMRCSKHTLTLCSLISAQFGCFFIRPQLHTLFSVSQRSSKGLCV